MLIVKKTTYNVLFACGLSLCGAGLAWAEDTEIFFGDFSAAATRPNVLFIVDTSGSMNNTVPENGRTRMQNVQEALTTLLAGLSNVNVGLMRFSNPGGPVLFPVDAIDRKLKRREGELINVPPVSIADGNDDAQEVVADGEMILNRQRLDMITTTVGGELQTPAPRPASDDAEERLNGGGEVSTDSPGLEISYDGLSLQLIGLRFSDWNIPAGATISDARIILRSGDGKTSSGAIDTRIWGQKRDSGGFSDDHYHLSKRARQTGANPPGTSAQVDWEKSDAVAANTDLETPDLTPVIQEIIDHPSWRNPADRENDIVLFIGPDDPDKPVTGRYEFDSLNRGTGGRDPRLRIEYYEGDAPTAEHTRTGLRFRRVSVPGGVTISNAFIDFTVAAGGGGEDTTLTIRGEDDDEPMAYGSSAGDISARTRTSADVDWTPTTWDSSGEHKSTPNLRAIVQEIVNRADWCGGDDMAFIIEGREGGLRRAWAQEAPNGYEPRLFIQYRQDSVIPGAVCMVRTGQWQIADSNDDVEEVGAGIVLTGDAIGMSGGRSIGLRFTGLNLPEGVLIREAWLEFGASGRHAGAGTYRIEVENSNDAALFTTLSDTLDERRWGSSIDWVETTDWNDGGRYRTDDIKTLVQAAVDHTGWRSGNDIAFRVTGLAGAVRRFESWDHDPLAAVKLYVSFEDDGTETAVRRVRDELLSHIAGLNTQGYTPIQDTLYEAALYYTGAGVDYGTYRGKGPYSYTRVSAADAMVSGSYTINRPADCSGDNPGAAACAGETITGPGAGPVYKTPIDSWCQTRNHIILLTDGQANQPHSDGKIVDFIGGSCDNTGLSPGQYCVKDLVRYLNEQDQSSLKETQRVTTHTIGFNFSSQWLRDVAAAGGGQYREATQARELAGEIEQILTSVLKTNSAFVAPVTTVNQFNHLNHRNEIYFAVFRPATTPAWPGNLKKYRLRESDNTVIDFADEPRVAVDPATGFFTDTAQSAWGGVQDGKEVHVGGAASKMPINTSRKLYTYLAGSPSTVLSHSANVISTANTALGADLLKVEEDDRVDTIKWILGQDVDDLDGDGNSAENRHIMGDPLHSRPLAISYGGSEDEPDITVFFGTNAGFMHAVNAATGEEQFAFIPGELLDKQARLRNNSITGEHIYGIDGSVTPWVHDADGDGVIESGEDFVYIFFGMRRGGHNYYALDVTDRANPKILWQIKGGQGSFPHLGQTWAQPVLGRIDIGGKLRDVLYLSGGYDQDQDDTFIRRTDDRGAVIYIVDAGTGEKIWSGGDGAAHTTDFPAMKYSFPAPLSVLDLTGSGTDNMFFVGDMGGQLWRFDIHNGASADHLISGGVIAELGVTEATPNSKLHNRRFYHAPDVALVESAGKTSLALTIGSGFHAHPLDTGTRDRFYMIRQRQVFSIPQSYRTLREDDLYDATDNAVAEGGEGAAAALAAKAGWFFDMPRTGEKVLSTPLSFRGTVTFTSYEPNPNSVSSHCIAAAGVSRVYQVSIDDAGPVNEWNDVTGLTADDRSRHLYSGAIMDEPLIVCTDAGCDLFVGAEKPPLTTPNTDRVVKTFWRREG